MSVIRRLGAWVFAFLIALDHLSYLIIAFVTYVLFNKGGKPSADLTMSAVTGYYAELGHPWALVCEKIINTLFFFQPNHCRNAILGDEQRAEEITQELTVSLRP